MIPAYFICHGSPEIAIADNEYTKLLRKIGRNTKPKAIVIFTAHWESDILTISSSDDIYDMIYDFGGFQKELYSIKYPGKGSSEIASQLLAMLEASGIKVKRDEKRGLDHGSWVVLRHMYPEADIPVVQVSVNPRLSPENQFQIGQAIKELGKMDIMVIGSGATVHNLFALYPDAKKPEPWAVEFDDWLLNTILNKDLKSLFDYRSLAPNARRAVPTEEHFAPLLIALGTGLNEKTPKILYRGYDYGTLTYICIEI